MCRRWAGGVRPVHITIKWRMRKEKMRKADAKICRKTLPAEEQVQEPRWTWAQRCEMIRNWSQRLPHLPQMPVPFLEVLLRITAGFWPFTLPLFMYCCITYLHKLLFALKCSSFNPNSAMKDEFWMQLQHLSFCPTPLLFSVPSQPLASCVILGNVCVLSVVSGLSNKREHSGIVVWFYWNNAHDSWRCVCHCKSLKYGSGGGG